MTEPDNILLVYLRRIDTKVDRLIDDVRDMKTRVTALEKGTAGIHERIDRIEGRLDRIERRLDLQEA